jgi:hypothetical protein
MLPSCFREKHDQERDQPLEALGTLIELNLDAEIILDGHFEVLTIGTDAQAVSFSASALGVPDGTDFVGEPYARGIQLIGPPVELVSVSPKGSLARRFGLVDLTEIG